MNGEETAVIRMAAVDDIPRIAAFYAASGYGGGITHHDTAWLAKSSGKLIGAVRIAPEHGTLVLRGMQIAEQWRRKGVGTRLLNTLASWLGNRTCYCIPYFHLEHFYERVGFREIPVAAAPSFLTARTAGYQQRGLDVLIMMRSETKTSRPG